ncbi:putative Methyltransferase [Nitrospira lenta]|uniref:Putative Methyltransferase n=2 Tax=Nitrospira lenta TaxID=1436998 RepID=A0A330LB59_9BACT|nr:putative Methyltransferase [Nitrospira lenta]
MRREQSQQRRPMESPGLPVKKPMGSLFLVGVPIGHPDDITIRALGILSRVDVIATEDPIATQELLSHHNLSVVLTSYGPTRIKEKVAVLINRLQQGLSVALVSDCGSPVISDPGSLLVAAAHKHAIPVCSIPGPSAVTAAITASGFSAEAFHFYGDIPAPTGSGKSRLAMALMHAEPTILFCQTQSCQAILETIAKAAPRRRIALACDLTLQNETVLKGTARRVSHLLKRIQTPHMVTLVVEGRKRITPAKTGRRRAQH